MCVWPCVWCCAVVHFGGESDRTAVTKCCLGGAVRCFPQRALICMCAFESDPAFRWNWTGARRFCVYTESCMTEYRCKHVAHPPTLPSYQHTPPYLKQARAPTTFPPFTHFPYTHHSTYNSITCNLPLPFLLHAPTTTNRTGPARPAPLPAARRLEGDFDGRDRAQHHGQFGLGSCLRAGMRLC